MVQSLTFTKNERNRWEGSFQSTGIPATVQLNVNQDVYYETSIDVIVYGNLPGMDKVILSTLSRSSQGQYYLFEVDVSSGVVVTIESLSEPIECKITKEE